MNEEVFIQVGTMPTRYIWNENITREHIDQNRNIMYLR